MRTFFLCLIAVASVAAGGAAVNGARSAATASQTVTISKTGYKPTAVSIAAGDAVLFNNTDTVAHTVTFKQTTGFKCNAAVPLVLAASGSASCTFSTAGKFNFSDPVNKGKSFRGTITVAPPPAASLGATPAAVVFGGKVTLAGALVDKQSGVSVQILAVQCGQSTATSLTTLKSTTGGAFSYVVQPLRQTAFTARVKTSNSVPATVGVSPRLRLGKIARHKYTLRVFAEIGRAHV